MFTRCAEPHCRLNHDPALPIPQRPHPLTPTRAGGTKAAQPGYASVIWRGRHVNDITELTTEEQSQYWSAVARVSVAVQQHYRPHKVNYEVLGNKIPHLHTHISCRYLNGDAAPGEPLPQSRETLFDVQILEADAAAIKTLLAE